MATAYQSSHDRIVRSLADDYISRGYDVSESPLPEQMPDFLRGFHPDLIVKAPNENIVIEVRSTGKVRRVGYWDDLKKAIEAHPDWKAQLVASARRESQMENSDKTLLNSQDAQKRIKASQDLASTELYDAALVVLWPVIESALWHGIRRERINVQNHGTAALITALYSKGSLHREEYDSLMQLLPARDFAAHGFKGSDIDSTTYRHALEVASSITARYLGINN